MASEDAGLPFTLKQKQFPVTVTSALSRGKAFANTKELSLENDEVEVIVGEVPSSDGVSFKGPRGRVQAHHLANAEWGRGSCCARSPTAKIGGLLVESIERKIYIIRTRRSSVSATSIVFVILTFFSIVFGRTIG